MAIYLSSYSVLDVIDSQDKVKITYFYWTKTLFGIELGKKYHVWLREGIICTDTDQKYSNFPSLQKSQISFCSTEIHTHDNNFLIVKQE